MNLLAIQYEDVSVERTFDAEAMADQFINSIDAKSNSKSTYRRQIKPFFEWLQAHYSMREMQSLSHLDIVAYKESLIQAGKSSYTVNGYVTVVRKLFEWLESQKLFPNVAKNVKGLKSPRGFRKECLTVERIREALAAFDITTSEGLRDYAIFNLLVRTGLRTVEITRATVGDLRQQSGEAVLWVQGKGRDSKDDFVILVEETLRLLRKYLASRGPVSNDAPLFSSTSNCSQGKPLKERTLRGIIKTVLRRIDIDDSRITAHSLRHTAVSLSIKGGATLIQAQAMARHADPKTTMIYFHNHERIKSGAERYVII
jgi:integrase/recombinase XerC/integrase/recombinase XerD